MSNTARLDYFSIWTTSFLLHNFLLRRHHPPLSRCPPIPTRSSVRTRVLSLSPSNISVPSSFGLRLSTRNVDKWARMLISSLRSGVGSEQWRCLLTVTAKSSTRLNARRWTRLSRERRLSTSTFPRQQQPEMSSLFPRNDEDSLGFGRCDNLANTSSPSPATSRHKQSVVRPILDHI